MTQFTNPLVMIVIGLFLIFILLLLRRRNCQTTVKEGMTIAAVSRLKDRFPELKSIYGPGAIPLEELTSVNDAVRVIANADCPLARKIQNEISEEPDWREISDAFESPVIQGLLKAC